MATESSPSANTPVAPPPKPRRRWLRFVLAILLFGSIGFWLAPMLVAQTALKQHIPRLLFPTYPGTIVLGQIRLDWLQPVVIAGLHAEDDQGRTLLDVKQFATDLPLWKLVTNPRQLGRLSFTEPTLTVELHNDGSNIEEVLARFLAGPSSTPPSFDLEIHGASVILNHKAAALTTQLAPVALLLQSRRGNVEELELTVGQVPPPDAIESAGDWLALRYGSQPTQEGAALAPGEKHVRVKAASWSLDRLQPLVKRWEPGAEFRGQLDADARAQFDPRMDVAWQERHWNWDGRLTLRRLAVAGLRVLKQDRLELDAISLVGRMAANQGRLAMDQVQLQTDVGNLTATGTLPLTAAGSTSPVALARSILSEQDYSIRGQVELQRLAALLPQTLRIQQGTEITGGQLDVTLTSAQDDAGVRRWKAEGGFDALQATHNGTAHRWEDPVRVSLAAHQSDTGVTIDQITATADFLSVTGRGTLDDAQVTATGDLTRLEQSLSKFVALGMDRVAGTMRAQGRIQRVSETGISLESTIQLEGFEWSATPEKVWQESRLVLGLAASGRTGASGSLEQIDAAELKLTSGGDTLVTTLQNPVDWRTPQSDWSFTSTLKGDLATWQNRLRPFTGPIGWQLAGAAQVDADVETTGSQVVIRQLAGTVTTLDARNADWWIKEPQFKFETAGQWSREALSYSSPQTTLAASSATCRLKDLVIDMTPAGGLERIAGDAAYRADLDKVSRWKNQALARPSTHLMGMLEGRSHIVNQAGSVTASLDARVANFVLAKLETLPTQQLHWVAQWREPDLRIVGNGVYESGTDSFRLQDATLTAQGLSLAARGSLAELMGAQTIDLQGELGYDWDVIHQRLGDSIRKSIRLRGKQTRPLALKGSLASLTQMGKGAAGPVNLTGNAGIGWDSALVEGLPLGPAEISAQLQRGVCQFAPIRTTVGAGRVQLTPQIRLDLDPMLVVLPPEKVIDQVHLTPEICNAWMKYVAPLLADATQNEGKFSLDVQGGALPLQDPSGGQLTGVLGVHHVKVRPGGGALQVTALLEQVKAILLRKPGAVPAEHVWMQMPEQSVTFRLAGRRIVHDAATFAIGEATVISSGSVGLDETVDLVLQVPIQDDWIRDQKLLAGLKGKALRIPVRGTLSRPQIDSRVLTELASQIGGTALEGVIENKLDDLFKKKLNQFLPQQK